MAEIEKTDYILLKERTALAANRMRVQYNMSGQNSKAKVGEAYLMAVTESFAESAGASYQKRYGRDRMDQVNFRNRLIKAYNRNASALVEQPPEFQIGLWCPISRRNVDSSAMKAAHIVPYSIGETNAAYIFGLKPNEGLEAIWSQKNGLMLHSTFEKLSNDGRMVIIPDPTEENEFISLILCQELLEATTPCPAINAPYNTLHKKRLKFQTSARPGKRYLYVHAHFSVFRRRRYDVPGWEADRTQVFGGKIWASPGKSARRSMIQALALEFGDSWEGVEEVEGLGEFPGAKSPEEERVDAMALTLGWEQHRASGVEESDDDEE